MTTEAAFKFDPQKIMRMAIDLAKTAQYQTEPNPIVGAVLVDEYGQVLASGYHKKAGSPHAEVVALDQYSEVPASSILFVTLEPCSHTGKTPPCVDLILKKKVETVVVGTKDPNPKVSGRGIATLKSHGVRVVENICRAECLEMNRVFNKHIVEKIPFVTVKSAASLDGKIAMPSGESRWITGEKARAYGHRLRSQYQAIAVGGTTLITDNPRLTDRISPNPRDPQRVVFSSRGVVPDESLFIRQTETRRFIIAGNGIDPKVSRELEKKGVHVLVAETTRPGIEWALKTLYTFGVCSLLLEGGAELIGSFVKEKMIDQLLLFLSGKLIGRKAAPSWSGETGLKRLSDSPQFKFDHVEKLGEDLLIICNPVKNNES